MVLAASVRSIASWRSSLLAVGATGIVAVVWELVELASDRLIGTRVQQGLSDTWQDIALGIAGALVVVIAAAITRAAAPPTDRS